MAKSLASRAANDSLHRAEMNVRYPTAAKAMASESVTQVNTQGQIYEARVMFRGLSQDIRVFYPRTSVVSRMQLQEDLNKIMPSAVVVRINRAMDTPLRLNNVPAVLMEALIDNGIVNLAQPAEMLQILESGSLDPKDPQFVGWEQRGFELGYHRFEEARQEGDVAATCTKLLAEADTIKFADPGEAAGYKAGIEAGLEFWSKLNG